MTTSFNPYNVFRMRRSAFSPEKLRKVYLGLAKKHHPDVGGNEELFKTIKKAYDILSDPIAKEKYDKYGLVEGDASSGVTFQAMNNLTNLLRQILSQVDPSKLEYTNITGEMEKALSTHISQIDKQLKIMTEKTEGENKTLVMLRNRLKCSDKVPNFLLEALEKDVAAFPGRIAALELEKKTTEESLRLLREFEYNFIQQAQFTTVVFR